MLNHRTLVTADNPDLLPPQPESAYPSPLQAPLSPARLAANRANALQSTGPSTPAGKLRSSANATRHGILAQVIPLSDDERPVYEQFLADYAAAFSPANAVETQLAYAAADLQFRLHRLAAAEHQLFQNGLASNLNPEALTFVNSLARCQDPLATLSIYEQRLNRRLLQTLKELRSIQSERRDREIDDLNHMRDLGHIDPNIVEGVEPSALGFVCSSEAWQFTWKRERLVNGPYLDNLRQQKATDRARHEKRKRKTNQRCNSSLPLPSPPCHNEEL